MDTQEKNNWLYWVGIIVIILLAAWGIYKLVATKAPTQIPIDNNSSSATTTATTTTDNLPAEWQTYVNAKYSYQFKYPQTITFSKNISVYPFEGGNPILYKANEPIPVKVEDVTSSGDSSVNSQVYITPLYTTVAVSHKPLGYTTLKDYVSNVVDQTNEAGSRSAAGVYATFTSATQNGLSGYLVVISDGSVVKNRDDKYYFEHGDYIYSFDSAYSGYNYENKDADEVAKVNDAELILSSFKFTK